MSQQIAAELGLARALVPFDTATFQRHFDNCCRSIASMRLFSPLPEPGQVAARAPESAWQVRVARQFYLRHLLWPVVAFVVASWLLMGQPHLDQWIADRLFAWEGHAWTLEHDTLLQGMFHVQARHLSILTWYAMTLVCVVAWVPWSPWARYRTPLLLLTISTSVSIAIIGWMKTWTNVDCPWDLHRYGGMKAFFGLFADRPDAYAAGNCFPAGHASAGYCWLALYFFFWMVAPRLRWLGLSLGFGFGLLYGGVQQLRGAHFLSHDLWTAMICWCTALAVFRMGGLFQAALRQPEQKQGHTDVANAPLHDNRHDVILSRTDKHAPF